MFIMSSVTSYVHCKCNILVRVKTFAGKHLMDLVAVDWFKDRRRMDHVARRRGCAAQASSSCFVSVVTKIFSNIELLCKTL